MEEVRFFMLWYFYGGNGAMAWRRCAVVELFGVAKNTFGGSSDLSSAGWI